MLNIRLAGDHLYGKLLFTRLSLVMSMMSFCAVLFPTRWLGRDLGLKWVSFWGFSYLPFHLRKKFRLILFFPNKENELNPKVLREKWSGINTIKSHIPLSTPQGKTAHSQTENCPRKTRTVNRIKTARSETGGYSVTLIQHSSNIYFYLFSILNYKTELNRKHTEQLLYRWPNRWRQYAHRQTKWNGL